MVSRISRVRATIVDLSQDLLGRHLSEVLTCAEGASPCKLYCKQLSQVTRRSANNRTEASLKAHSPSSAGCW